MQRVTIRALLGEPMFFSKSGQDEDEAVRHLWGKLAILLQRGNAAMLANRVPEFPAPAIDGRYCDPWRVPWASTLIGPWGFSSALMAKTVKKML